LFLLLLAGLLGPGVVASQLASAASTSASTSTSTFNFYLYCGEQWDADLGLYFNRARCLNVADSGVAAAQKIEGAGQWATTAVKKGLATASAKAQQAMAGVREELGYQLDVWAYRFRQNTGTDPFGRHYMVEPGPPLRHSGSAAGATAAERTATQLEFNFGAAYERQNLAHNFYKANGVKEADIASHLRGIDFTKPVDIITVPKGTDLVQFGFPGDRMGRYFARPGASPSRLGIYPKGRVESLVRTLDDLPALQSTAADVIDDWSIKGLPINVRGGETQIFIPKY
jgi:hypothetical protein